ncbi:non-oxidative hydroxyarylic acid decarboxylases subunit D [Mesoterricola silvestris]|uniref:Vanillic acid non-oxidative decarboxylation protein n=1 Tax=Mesoterricola silvestris TaxID=2927979 RepID=A0AA48GFM9_9BACT|nr:non-oxidative hydroxyarylic acid decarboxylases subunit D [Mesoterricola silvestris]BDU71801.1 vanillic acid non-oxidative decarboxylation gene [Mesoterricola silvestris]
MICPRCDTDKVEVMATSPVGHVWELYLCKTCTYSWRSTETPNKTDPKLYNHKFKIKPETIPSMLVIPPVPPLKA